jgi:hypothetical protein
MRTQQRLETLLATAIDIGLSHLLLTDRFVEEDVVTEQRGFKDDVLRPL